MICCRREYLIWKNNAVLMSNTREENAKKL